MAYGTPAFRWSCIAHLTQKQCDAKRPLIFKKHGVWVCIGRGLFNVDPDMNAAYWDWQARFACAAPAVSVFYTPPNSAQMAIDRFIKKKAPRNIIRKPIRIKRVIRHCEEYIDDYSLALENAEQYQFKSQNDEYPQWLLNRTQLIH